MSVKTDSVKVTILVMGRHFLYLPLYLAESGGDPSSGAQPFFGMVPPRYSIEIKPPPLRSRRTDAGVFDALMDAAVGSSDIMFAACDPTVLVARPDSRALMAASIISSSAFWAVNHESKNVKLVSDLASFDRIICYGENTTSNLIARRIVKHDTGKLHVVDSTEEIQALIQFGEGTLALSPELLDITNLLYETSSSPHQKRYEIVLELSTSKEFSNVLTTALFTRTDVLDRYPDLVAGVLSAVQRALVNIHLDLPMVAACVRHNYRDAYRLDEALALARSSNVFPETIQVRLDRWQRACEFYYLSNAIAEGEERTTLTRTEELATASLYDHAVRDRALRKIVDEALSRAFGIAASSVATSWTSSIPGNLSLIATGFWICLLWVTAVSLTTKIALAFSWVFMSCTAAWSANVVGYRRWSLPFLAHCIGVGLLWWSLHNTLVLKYFPDAHFALGFVELSDDLASWIASVVSGLLLTLGNYFYAKKAAGSPNESR